MDKTIASYAARSDGYYQPQVHDQIARMTGGIPGGDVESHIEGHVRRLEALRRAGIVNRPEAGCSANEIAAITGHATLAEISRYTKAAEQRTLARSAISRLAHNPSVHRVPNPSSQFGTNSEKSNEINVDLFNWRPVGRSNPLGPPTEAYEKKWFFF